MDICSTFLLAVLTAVAADPDSTAQADRVGFPKYYATKFSVLRVTTRDEGAKIVTVYGNALAATVTNKSQLPYPYGAVIVMESATARKSEKGEWVKDAQGQPQKDTVTGLHVMRKEKEFGVQYGEKRSGEWEFVEYKPDGTFITAPQKSASCAECHIKAGAAKDFVYHGRFAE